MIQNGFSTKFILKYVEIYNETIIDLFTRKNVTLGHDNNGIVLKNIFQVESNDIEVILKKMKEASKKRSVGETQSNRTSSRSHAIFILDVELESEKEKRKGSLCLIDLAGSERLNESKAENERLKETQNINKSLSALGNVFTAIKRKDGFVPFRDSKLTHLMQEYLTGQSRTIMIVNINPSSGNESICTLRFAAKVSECTLGSVERKFKTIGHK